MTTLAPVTSTLLPSPKPPAPPWERKWTCRDGKDESGRVCTPEKGPPAPPCCTNTTSPPPPCAAAPRPARRPAPLAPPLAPRPAPRPAPAPDALPPSLLITTARRHHRRSGPHHPRDPRNNNDRPPCRPLRVAAPHRRPASLRSSHRRRRLRPSLLRSVLRWGLRRRRRRWAALRRWRRAATLLSMIRACGRMRRKRWARASPAQVRPLATRRRRHHHLRHHLLHHHLHHHHHHHHHHHLHLTTAAPPPPSQCTERPSLSDWGTCSDRRPAPHHRQRLGDPARVLVQGVQEDRRRNGGVLPPSGTPLPAFANRLRSSSSRLSAIPLPSTALLTPPASIPSSSSAADGRHQVGELRVPVLARAAVPLHPRKGPQTHRRAFRWNLEETGPDCAKTSKLTCANLPTCDCHEPCLKTEYIDHALDELSKYCYATAPKGEATCVADGP